MANCRHFKARSLFETEVCRYWEDRNPHYPGHCKPPQAMMCETQGRRSTIRADNDDNGNPDLVIFSKNQYVTIMANQFYNKVNSPLDPHNGGPGKRGSHPGATSGPTFSGPTGKTGKPTLILCFPGCVYIRIRANTKPPYQNHCLPYRPYFTPTGRAGGRPIGRRGRAKPGLWHTGC